MYFGDIKFAISFCGKRTCLLHNLVQLGTATNPNNFVARRLSSRKKLAKSPWRRGLRYPSNWPPKLREGALPFTYANRMAAEDPTLKPILVHENFIKTQKFQYFLVLDFEATCDSSAQPVPQEIIEFPCLKINAETFAVESKFHHYVRPTVHPDLTQFCTDLTGILQVMVEDQPDFPTVLKLFNEWLVKENLLPCENAEKPESKTQTSAQTDDGIPQAKFAFVTCGDWDLKKMLPAQLKQHNLPIDSHFKSWINIKKSFHTKIGTFPRGMMVMLASLDIGHTGRHHSGIDDTQNIAEILKKLGQMGLVFEINSSLE